MRSPCVVFYGDFSAERIRWEELEKEVPCSVRLVRNLMELDALRAESEIMAVYAAYDCAAEFVRIQACAPDARLVICYPLSLPLMAEELVALGAFHSVPRPLDEGEVRQSFGFVLENWRRRARRLRRVATTAA
jgi:hypothetical protein